MMRARINSLITRTFVPKLEHRAAVFASGYLQLTNFLQLCAMRSCTTTPPTPGAPLMPPTTTPAPGHGAGGAAGAGSGIRKLTPCGLSQETLLKLMEKCLDANGNPNGLFKNYFYKASDPTLNPDTKVLVKKHNTPNDDIEHRCRSCGCTIPEHAKESSTSLQQDEIPGLFSAVKEATQTPLNGSPFIEALEIAPPFSWFTDAERPDQPVYVRSQHYPHLWARLQEVHKEPSGDRKHLLIMGNPGIGKSWSLNYLLHMALKHNLASLVILHCFDGWFAFHDGKVYKSAQHPGAGWVNARSSPTDRALTLLDCVKSGGQRAIPFNALYNYGRDVCLVLAASPSKVNYHEFYKYRQPRWFVMPTWSREEFTMLLPDSEDEYTLYGGTIRGVGDPDREKLVAGAIKDFNFTQLAIQNLGMTASSLIAKMVPNDDYGLGTVDFHTSHIAKLLYQSRADLCALSPSELAGKLTDTNWRAEAGGAFEKYVHEYCHLLKFAETTSLDGAGTGAAILAAIHGLKPPAHDTFVTHFQSDSADAKAEIAKVSKASRWIKPKVDNFVVFDALLVIGQPAGGEQLVVGVQITTAKEHQPTRKNIETLRDKKITYGSLDRSQGHVHVDAVLFVVDSHRSDPMNKRQNVPTEKGKDKDKASFVPWNDAATFPHFILRTNCKEYVAALAPSSK